MEGGIAKLTTDETIYSWQIGSSLTRGSIIDLINTVFQHTLVIVTTKFFLSIFV